MCLSHPSRYGDIKSFDFRKLDDETKAEDECEYREDYDRLVSSSSAMASGRTASLYLAYTHILLTVLLRSFTQARS